MPRPTLPPELLSISEAAVVLGVTRQAVYQALDNGRITEHSYEGRRCVLRQGLRKQWFNSTQLRVNSPIQRKDALITSSENVGEIIRSKLDHDPELADWWERLADLCRREVALHPADWPDGALWEPWRWATVATAIAWAHEELEAQE